MIAMKIVHTPVALRVPAEHRTRAISNATLGRALLPVKLSPLVEIRLGVEKRSARFVAGA